MYKRYLLILAVAVIAVVLLWPDDEPSPEKKKKPAVNDTLELRPPQHAPWQLRQPSGGRTRQLPRSPTYPAPREAQPPHTYPPYSGGETVPYTTPGQQPGLYESYGVQPQYPTQPPAPQPEPYQGYGVQPQQTTPQPAPYGSYGYRPQQQPQGYGMAPQPQQYPGRAASPATPYEYSRRPPYRFRPLDEKETSRRYQGQYPRPDYTYPGAPPPSHGSQR